MLKGAEEVCAQCTESQCPSLTLNRSLNEGLLHKVHERTEGIMLLMTQYTVTERAMG